MAELQSAINPKLDIINMSQYTEKIIKGRKQVNIVPNNNNQLGIHGALYGGRKVN